MGERKVLNKYYPADFDPSKLPKKARPKNNQQKVRVMLPMTICCNTCHEYIYKGKKFNSRKETVEGEEYLGIKIFRFYIKCTKCSSEITFKTDPEHSDYNAEFGCTRNYEPYSWRMQEEAQKEQDKKKEEIDNDAIARLEARTKQRKQEMEDIEKLDELKMLSGRNDNVEVDKIFEVRKLEDEQAKKEEEEEEEELASIEFKNSQQNSVKKISNDSVIKPIPISKKIVKLTKKPTRKGVGVISAKKNAERPSSTDALASLIGSY